ncbi:MAG TPA: hypothetical protein PKH40_02540 [Treponemataceae bacterium]|jgi:V/A-type H+-transporting ATPase subunit E|nr:MAG: V-type ATP synthase subunit E [Spirochaetes bacterium ADurb.Bin269]TAH54767.1 MAG: hypothetical protein EWM51_05440 [Treponema sp.]HOC28537.1 hypothetical protein [Treponemataceae bacterium]HPX47338.1 hypothetical protein [Treponemataceae bacterium]HQL31880.1 hypothetical protein [Treponemataceae bacterium]
MEELRSTEILDREIQEDARKKAEKILKTADAECAEILAQVTFRIERVKAEKTAEYASRLEAVRRDSSAAIPLEKQRRLVSYVDRQVREAILDWFSSLSAEKRLALLSRHAERYRTALAGKPLVISVCGYGEKEVASLAAGLFGSGNIASVRTLSASEAERAGFSDGFYIETEDASIACRVSLEEVRDMILSDKRQELADCLLAGRLPE